MLVGMGSAKVAGTWGADSSAVASKYFLSIEWGAAKSKLYISKGCFQSGRSVVLVARKCDSENLRARSGQRSLPILGPLLALGIAGGDGF